MEISESSTSAPASPLAAPAQFYIAAKLSLQERHPRTLKHGETFGLFDHYGDVVPEEGSPYGLFHQDTRVLSGFQLLVNGQRPLLLSSAVDDDNAVLSADLTNADFFEHGRLSLPRETIHIVRSKFIWQASAHERVAVRNFGDRMHFARVTFLFQSDFADLFEVRGHKRCSRGVLGTMLRHPQTVVFNYHGVAGDTQDAIIEFAPAPDLLSNEQASFDLTLRPGERISLFVTVKCEGASSQTGRTHGFLPCLRNARRSLREASSKATSVTTSNAIFNEVMGRSIADLHMLLTETDHGPYPYAGIPWFSTAFGRDGIITAAQLLWLDPEIAKGVLRFLATHQATETRPEAEAEPGKILHETRRGELARIGEIPFGLYYGSVDSTPLFLVLAGMYVERTGDLQTIRQLWPNFEAALQWMDRYGDRDGDGFIEYQARNERGLSNQGWKDSQDAVFHVDGSLADGAIALCEVQGYAYAARRAAARLARALGHHVLAGSLEKQAETLRGRFEAAFWCEDLGTYALALDGDKQPCRVKTSNAGQTLLSGIAAPDRAARLADLLLDRESFSGWGIRTVAASESRYNPMSYHNGSVWPHDNALVALGFARYGLTEQTLTLLSGMFDAAAYMYLRRLPELFCGFRRVPGKGPTFYPVACSPQAWASAAPFAMLQACLGLTFDPAVEEVRFRQPRLPDFLDAVVIRKLRVGDSCFDIMLRRHGRSVSVDVLDRVGDGQVAVTI
jgi:glycogen debranching enzyme